MIEELLERARRRADGGADALWRRLERTTLAFDAGRLKAAGTTEEAGANLRVCHRGKVGVAGTTATASPPDELVARAIAAAELGEPLELVFPAPAALPEVATYFAAAAAAPLDRLIALGAGLVERLAREGCQVNVAIDRETAETRVANTAGAVGAYRSTAFAVGATVWRIAGDDVLAVSEELEAADIPLDPMLADLVASINTRLDHALRVVASPEGALPVVFTPGGLSALMLPVTQALSGKAVLQGSSPLAGKLGERLFDAAFFLTDDPHCPGRTSSRPLDDECVPSHVLPLVERGVVRRFIYDLETAARAHTASTGHGHRGVFEKPALDYTNLRLTDGPPRVRREPAALGGGLLPGIGDGLLVDELIGVGQGNVIGGAFSHPVGLAYRIERGEIVGRVKEAAVAGNAYELWRRVGGFGSDHRWVGSRYAPSVLIDGVSVARR